MGIKLKFKVKQLDQENLTNLVLATNRLQRDTPYTVYFCDDTKGRSLAQNRYLWGVVYAEIENQTGYRKEEIHEMCKLKFALRTVFDLGGHGILEAPMSTRIMSTVQMAEYIDKIVHWALETLHIPIPSPNQANTDEAWLEANGYV